MIIRFSKNSQQNIIIGTNSVPKWVFVWMYCEYYERSVNNKVSLKIMNVHVIYFIFSAG